MTCDGCQAGAAEQGVPLYKEKLSSPCDSHLTQ